jgi:hypothetical protein
VCGWFFLTEECERIVKDVHVPTEKKSTEVIGESQHTFSVAAVRGLMAILEYRKQCIL